MADSVYVEQNSTVVDDYRDEPIIHTITVTSDGDLTMVETSSSPVKVEILQHARTSEECLNLYPVMESANCSNETKVSELIHTDTPPESSSLPSDQDTKTEGEPRLLLNGRESVTVEQDTNTEGVPRLLLNGREIVTVEQDTNTEGVPRHLLNGREIITVEQNTKTDGVPRHLLNEREIVTVDQDTKTDRVHVRRLLNGREIITVQQDTKTEGVPRLLLKGREIITVPDVYLAIRKIWKSKGSLQRLMPKLGIQVMRFLPQELTAMKQKGEISLTVKCCSYIFRSDFESIAEKYDKMHGTHHKENITFLPLVDLDNYEFKLSIPAKAQSPITSAKDNCRGSPAGFKMQTILLSTGQTVICTNELQGVFEAHFQNLEILNHCLFNLGIHQGQFTDYQLEESNASFVSAGSDGTQLDHFSRSYIAVDDAEKVVNYATSLLNTSNKPEIKWTEPQKVRNGQEDSGEAAVVESHSTDHEEGEGQHRPVGLSSSGGGKTVVIMKSSGSKREEGSSVGCPVSSGRSCANDQGVVGASRNLKASGVDGETSSTSTSNGHSVLRHFARHFDSSVQTKVSDSQPALSTGNCSTQPEVVVRTFLVDGEVVVCIPDVHKVVIHLFNQSVQVGYYMQRLQITPHRFSCARLKHLKAYDVLNAKATVCTYITKPDAERLLHMFDLSYTESRLHEIHWAEPIVLDDVPTIQSKCKETVHETKVAPENEGNSQSPTTIPTFEIGGEVYVSVPDAHRAVQTLNGQSVQLRYNLDKLGIPKYKFSYSQVYQMKACTTIKRPSTCTFIAKGDAERLVQFYANHGNASRLALIEWLPPVKVGLGKETSHVNRSDATACGQLSDGNEKTASGSDCCSTFPESRTPDPLGCSSSTCKPQSPGPVSQTSDAKASQGNLDEFSVLPDVHLLPEAHNRTEAAHVSEAPSTYYCSSCYIPGNMQRTVAPLCMCVQHGGHHPVGVQMQCPSETTASSSFAIVNSYNSSSGRSIPGASGHLGQSTACVSTDQDGCIVGEKRAHSEEEGCRTADMKKLRGDNEELINTIKRKETEFKLLHDAYQQRIESERERREKAEQELEELKRRCQCFSVKNERLDK